MIVIEKGDIFVMMPDEFDKPTVHIVHSPIPTLMEGWMNWDKARITSTLKCLLQIGHNQISTNEAIAFQLAPVLDILEKSMYAEGMSPEMKSALQRVKDMGCTCGDGNDDDCCCAASDRRCTSVCRNHPPMPEIFNSKLDWPCMEDCARDQPCGRQRSSKLNLKRKRKG